ncbi:tissue factor pathway inhibitor 2-like isoform X4 [Leptotrombidium deliense]|uniref:Tissue factor pathway inhibitor 2-like isoform X4 n=1 Tax=Leptotrombidium deliense TaxID=299467 RepID=A0A443SCE9_9ACAR|nr:tissue factor pathway inhibitor 2-like isoform X4 [Leptotrombidium deliense]
MLVNIIFMLLFEALTPMLTEDVCSQKADHGGCRSILVRWYFNNENNKCERFIFGGCKGNKNNFVSEDLCQSHCLPQLRTAVDLCNQPKVTGPCRGYFKRFWHNNDTRKCEEFVYGGCEQNENNFEMAEECVKRCDAIGVEYRIQKLSKRSDAVSICELPAEKGPCVNFTSRFFFNSKTKRCEKFAFGGCTGNDNNFKSFAECRKVCIGNEESTRKPLSTCKLPKRTGRCRARHKRFYFNSETLSCQQFVYGGCSGNANNFKTIETCERLCASQKHKSVS